MAKLVELTLPVFNEVKVLERNVHIILDYFKSFPYELCVNIVDNGSNDGTDNVGRYLASRFPRVRFSKIQSKGRGHALVAAWSSSTAEVVSYMDIDLSTDLKHYLPLINAVFSGYDIATGVRLHPASKVQRSLKREILSRGYAALFRLILSLKVTDAQCGFKAIRRESFLELLPHLRDREWFFDTELLYRAQKAGMRVKEIPVKWVEDPDSRVEIGKVIFDYIISLFCLRFNIGRFKN